MKMAAAVFHSNMARKGATLELFKGISKTLLLLQVVIGSQTGCAIRG